MVESATTTSRTSVRHPADAPTRTKRVRELDARAHQRWQLEQRIIAEYPREEGKRGPTAEQVRNMAAFWPLVEAGLREGRNGDAVKRSVPQMARAMAPHCGWDVAGLNAKQLHNRYRNQLSNIAGYFIRMGWLESWECDQTDPYRAAILLRVPAGVAQSVRAAES